MIDRVLLSVSASQNTMQTIRKVPRALHPLLVKPPVVPAMALHRSARMPGRTRSVHLLPTHVSYSGQRQHGDTPQGDTKLIWPLKETIRCSV